MSADDALREDRADRLARRFAVPVLIAALASVPAVFLTLMDDPWETVGSGMNTASGAVLIAETVILFAVSENRLAWLRRNWWLVALTAVIIPAIIFAVGPVQLLRLARPLLSVIRFAGALRIIRVRRIFKAGRILRERLGITRRWERVLWASVTVLCAAFVAVVLADPTSASREFLEGVHDVVGTPGIVLAGLLLAGATYLVWSARNEEEEEASREGGEDAAARDEDDDADDADDADVSDETGDVVSRRRSAGSGR